MKHFRFLAMLLFTATLVFTACGDDGGDNGGTTPVIYAIGDIGPSGVGIVFYITDGGLHGLEVAPVDQSTGAAWSTITDAFANGTTALPVDIGTGSANTDAIILQNSGAASAAKICRDYRATEEGDWFLPSRDELTQLHLQKANVPGGFTDGVAYWSSTDQSDADKAWYRNLNGTTQNYTSKTSGFHVRAVRAF